MAAVPDPPSVTAVPLTHQDSRPPRLHVASFNGTWAGGLSSSRRTVVSEFVRLISKDENVYETAVNGVGSDIGWVDWAIGGAGGWGTLRNVITAWKNIASHYQEGDRIILNGYSRGAWAARYLAMLINLVGLPQNGDEKLFCRVYKACSDESIFQDGSVKKLLDGYQCWTEVKINALCCFDTVGSLGLPLTGIAKPLTVLRSLKKKKRDRVSDVAPNVEFSFHCLSLHENREPCGATLMRGDSVHQVSFPGRHGNLGWIDDTEGLVHGPFAWMIQQVHTHLRIRFDEAKLATRFPSYRAPSTHAASTLASTSTSTPPLVSDGSSWYRGRLQHVNTGLLAIIGKKPRMPGHINCPDGATDLKVHVGARLRNDLDDENTVPGYTLMAPVTGMPYWTRKQQRSRWTWRHCADREVGSNESLDKNSRKSKSWPRTAERIEEAEVGALEARLLGLPDEVVAGARVC